MTALGQQSQLVQVLELAQAHCTLKRSAVTRFEVLDVGMHHDGERGEQFWVDATWTNGGGSGNHVGFGAVANVNGAEPRHEEREDEDHKKDRD